MNNLFLKHLATQGAVGYSQAPGTIATFMMLPFVWYLSLLHLPMQWYCVLMALLIGAGWYVVEQALVYFDAQDPAEIVLDEMVAFPLVFVALPITISTLAIGFALFRLFDICKPLCIARIEHVPGAAGIMLDDIAAALLANLVLQALVYAGLFV